MKTLHVDFRNGLCPEEFKQYSISGPSATRISIQMNVEDSGVCAEILAKYDEVIMHATLLSFDAGRILPAFIK